MAAKTAPAPYEITCPDPSVHEKQSKLSEHASAAALLAAAQDRKTGSNEQVLGADGKMSPKSAAKSIKYAKPTDLPGFPSHGGTNNTTANAAALLANDHKMKDLWQPEASAAGSKAALKAHKEGGPLELWEPSATSAGNAAAALAMRNKSLSPSIGPIYTDAARTSSLAAATKSAYLGRQRAESSPVPALARTREANSGRSALNAATASHRSSARAPDGWSSEANQAARIKNIGNHMDREMFTEHPPVGPEVDEQQHQAALRASAVSMAKQMFEHQQRSSDNGSNVGSAGAGTAHRRNKSSTSQADVKEEAVKYIHLQDAAHKLAQERLAKIDREMQEGRYHEYYGYNNPSPKKSRLSMGSRPRNRASSDSRTYDFEDDEQQARRIRTQMSQLSSGLSTVDDKKRKEDRARLQAAAEKRVHAQMHEMDEKVFLETGKPSQAMMDEWEATAREKVEKDREQREKNPGKTHIGGGKYMDSAEIEAIAAARLKPTLDEINDTAEKKRARDEETKRKIDAAETARMEEKMKDRDTKAEFKRIREQDKLAARKAKDERKAAERKEKEDAKAKREEEKRKSRHAKQEEIAAIVGGATLAEVADKVKDDKEQKEKEEPEATEKAEAEEPEADEKAAKEEPEAAEQAEKEMAKAQKEDGESKLAGAAALSEVAEKLKKEEPKQQDEADRGGATLGEIAEKVKQDKIEEEKQEEERKVEEQKVEEKAQEEEEEPKSRVGKGEEVVAGAAVFAGGAALVDVVDKDKKVRTEEPTKPKEKRESGGLFGSLKKRFQKREDDKQPAAPQKRTEDNKRPVATDKAAVKSDKAAVEPDEGAAGWGVATESAVAAAAGGVAVGVVVEHEAAEPTSEPHETTAIPSGDAEGSAVAPADDEEHAEGDAAEAPHETSAIPAVDTEGTGVAPAHDVEDEHAEPAHETGAPSAADTEGAAVAAAGGVEAEHVAAEADGEPHETAATSGVDTQGTAAAPASGVEDEHAVEEAAAEPHETGTISAVDTEGTAVAAGGVEDEHAEGEAIGAPRETAAVSGLDTKDTEVAAAAGVEEQHAASKDMEEDHATKEDVGEGHAAEEKVEEERDARQDEGADGEADEEDEDEEAESGKVEMATAISAVAVLGGAGIAARDWTSSGTAEPEEEKEERPPLDLSSENDEDDEDAPGEHTGHYNFAMASPAIERDSRPNLERHISTIQDSDEDSDYDADDDDDEGYFVVEKPTESAAPDQTSAPEEVVDPTPANQNLSKEEEPAVSREASDAMPAVEQRESPVSPLAPNEDGRITTVKERADPDSSTLIVAPRPYVHDDDSGAPAPTVKPFPFPNRKQLVALSSQHEKEQGGVKGLFGKLKHRAVRQDNKLTKKNVTGARTVNEQKSSEAGPANVTSNGKEERTIAKDDIVTPVTTTEAGKADAQGLTAEGPSSFRRQNDEMEDEDDVPRGRSGRVAPKLADNGKEEETIPDEGGGNAGEKPKGDEDQVEEARDQFDESLAPQPAFAGSTKGASPSRETKFHEDF